MAKGYTTQNNVENYIGYDISVDLASQVTVWIEMAEDYIDTYTDRNFVASQEVRKYSGNDDQEMYIDDTQSITTVYFVNNNSTADAGTQTVPTTDFLLYHFDDPNEKPYNKIELFNFGRFGFFPYGQQNIWIDGLFGYSETVPADIKYAATKIVASIVRTAIDQGQEMKQFSQGELSITYTGFKDIIERDISITQLLDGYKKGAKLFSGKVLKV